MARILLVGDVHLRDTPPVNCTPEFLDDLWHSLNVIATMSSDYAATVFAGDVFDFKQPSKTSHALMLRAIETFGSMHNPWVIAGNHDLSSDRIETLQAKQPLGVLIASGAVRWLDGWMSNNYDELPNLPIFGLSWQQDWLNDSVRTFALDGYASPARGERITGEMPHSLLVTHAPIFPKGSEPPYEFIDLDSLRFDLGPLSNVFYGHIHDDHGIFTHDTVTFANHGSLNRARLTKSDLTRTVAVTAWDSNTGEFTRIDIPDQLPAAKIFRLDAANATKAEARSLDEFLAAVGRSSIDMTTTHAITSHIMNSDAPKPVRHKAVDLIMEAEQ